MHQCVNVNRILCHCKSIFGCMHNNDDDDDDNNTKKKKKKKKTVFLSRAHQRYKRSHNTY